MAKYEIDVPDSLDLRWSNDWSSPLPQAEIIPEMVIGGLKRLIEVYGDFPEIATEKHRAALIICRNLAAERASNFGARERGGDLEMEAVHIFQFMVGER
jgi:hypothetical protein